MKTSPSTPEAVVQRQLDAFNARDVEAMAATYAVDAQQFEHPSKLLASGMLQLRERWTARFKDQHLHASLISRIVSGHTVIDHEEVVSTYSEGRGKLELVAIYEVKEGKIAKAWFIVGTKTLGATS